MIKLNISRTPHETNWSAIPQSPSPAESRSYRNWRAEFAQRCQWLRRDLWLRSDNSRRVVRAFRQMTISNEAFAIAHANTGRRRHRMQRAGVQVITRRIQILGKLRGFYIAMGPLLFSHRLLIEINQHHVFHIASVSEPPAVAGG